jgi:hypothetical protein
MFCFERCCLGFVWMEGSGVCWCWSLHVWHRVRLSAVRASVFCGGAGCCSLAAPTATNPSRWCELVFRDASSDRQPVSQPASAAQRVVNDRVTCSGAAISPVILPNAKCPPHVVLSCVPIFAFFYQGQPSMHINSM